MVAKLFDEVILYHGSYIDVTIPDLSKCAKFKDFGRGLYVTSDKKQAENFSKLSTRKARQNGVINDQQNYGVVSIFKYHHDHQLTTKIFPTTNSEWLHCIVAHRKENTYPEIIEQLQKYDIIGGKIANDNTNATINTYLSGGYGQLGSPRAEEICISLLLPERLQDQYCFRTPAAIQCLEFIESERIWT